MASAITEGGTPLDEYFRDEDDQALHFHEGASSLENVDAHGQRHSSLPDDLPPVDSTYRSEIPELAAPVTITPQLAISEDTQRSHDQPTSSTSLPTTSGPTRETGNASPGNHQESPEHIVANSGAVTTDAFAENFKYVICSSGVLEKEYVSVLGGSMDENNDVGDIEDDATNTGNESLEVEIVYTKREAWRSFLGWADEKMLEAMALGSARKDITGAGLVLIVAIWYIVGIWRLVLAVGIAGAGISAIVMTVSNPPIWKLRLHPPRAVLIPEPRKSSPKRPAETPAQTGSPPSLRDEPSPRSLRTLDELLSSSRQMDRSVEKCFNFLQSRILHPRGEQLSHSLRLAMHRFTGIMVDHLATATSVILPMADKSELAVLGDMYDIPVTGSVLYPRVRREHSGDDEIDPNQDVSSIDVANLETILDQSRSGRRSWGPTASVPSPRKQMSSEYAGRQSFSRLQDEVRSMPMSISMSLPGDSRPVHNHTHHLSLNLKPSPRKSLSPVFPDDRFTSLPARTPRSLKHGSWDHDLNMLGQAQDSEDSPIISLFPGRPPSARRLSRPKHERRITEANEEEESESPDSSQEREILDSLSPPKTEINGVPGGSNSTSPQLQVNINPYTPKRNSPLSSMSRANGMTPPRRPLSFPDAPVLPIPFTPTSASSPAWNGNRNSQTLFPSPFAASDTGNTPNHKRRSLQNMPYYPSFDEDPANQAGNLARTRSMPFSDTQQMRERYATGSRSRATSISQSRYSSHMGSVSSQSPGSARMRQSYTSPLPPRLQRVMSVSPLTTPALKASCLGIHLRRRRLACCLLGLRFDQGDEYWTDVNDVLDTLVRHVIQERKELEAALQEVKKTFEEDSSRDQAMVPPWRSTSFPDGHHLGIPPIGDFAPKSSDEQLLRERIDGMQKALVRAWEELADTRKTLYEADATERGGLLRKRWDSVREDLGIMFREWTRGDDGIKTLIAEDSTQTPRSVSPDQHQPTSTSQPAQKPELVPTFLQTMGNDVAETNNQHLETKDADDNADLCKQDTLPPPGVDVVFESEVADMATVKAKSTLSREERIALTKEARAKGITVAELLEASKGNGDVNSLVKDREAKIRGGAVVDELKGMIGIIRARKGVAEEEPTLTTRDDVEARGAAPTRRVSSNGSRVAGDLAVASAGSRVEEQDWRREFVFPSSAVASTESVMEDNA